jgi:hypothetical protein
MTIPMKNFFQAAPAESVKQILTSQLLGSTASSVTWSECDS